jgi:hypothetical protein
MIYFLIAFLFSYTTGLAFFVWRKANKPKVLIIEPSTELKPYIQKLIDESVDLSKKEFRTVLGNYRIESDKNIMIIASNAFIKNYAPFIPNCLIKAKEKGYFDEENVIIYNEVRSTFNSLVSVTENEIIISIFPAKPLFYPCKIEIPIYKDGMWADIIIEKISKDNK